jgi:hypothetical protein
MPHVARSIGPMRDYSYAGLHPVLSFDIVFDLGDGFSGITLIGPPGETSGSLAVGDTLLVPTKDGGQASCEGGEFPLVNLGPERVAWVRVSITGVCDVSSHRGHPEPTSGFGV